MKRVLLTAGLCLLAACSAGPVETLEPASPAPPTLPASTATATPSPAPIPTKAPLPELSATAPEPALCSPLAGLALEELPEMIANPYHPPPLGSDDPHQGVDFAERLGGDGAALEGLTVQAVLSGRVAGVIADRFPYGNALLFETRLEDLPEGWLAQIQLPTPGPTLEARSALTCPASAAAGWDLESRSLYLLYAHMKEKPALEAGGMVQCGQAVGAIGGSGNALNPHLHLEARVGPAGARFSGLAHYDSSATSEEMANYCLWRVSGLFQHLDPLKLLSVLP